MAMKFAKTSETSYLLDVCGYLCPHPQIYTKKSLEQINENDVLHIVLDNPSSIETITQMCDQGGHEVVERRTQDGKIHLKIKKG